MKIKQKFLIITAVLILLPMAVSTVVISLVVLRQNEAEAWARIAEVDARLPVVLQPVTPFGRVREAPTAQRLLELVERASRTLGDVRLIPQTHPVIGAL